MNVKPYSSPMWKRAAKHGWTLFAVIALTALSLGQSIPGTLAATPTITTTSGTCSIRTTTYAWTFTDSLGSAHPFPATTNTHILEGCSSTCGGRTKSGCTTGCGCPPTGSTSENEWSSDGQFYLQATASTGNVSAASGYISPKYLVMGVTYAPPGGNSQSSVSYGTTDFVGNTSNNTSSFSQNYTFSTSICGATGTASCGGGGGGGSTSGGIFGFGGGVAITGSESSAWTLASNTTNTVTVTKQTSLTQKTPGIPNVYSPVNHDYDIIWLWLNPLVRFTVLATDTSTSGTIYWNGYGYDWSDPLHEIDVWPIYVGYLNGDFGPMDSQDADALSRGWVTTQTFGPGQNAAITSADFPAILAADPFGANPAYNVVLAAGTTPPTTTDGRFTLAEAANNTVPESFDYKQAPPDSTVGQNVAYNDQYSTTNTTGKGASKTFAQGFGLEEKFGGSFFWQSVQYDFKQNWTYTWVDSWQNTVTNTTTQTGNLSITGPPCPAAVAPCIPQYTEPHEFAVYEDNLYGTFMFWPNPYFGISATPASQTVKPGSSTTFTIPTTANAGYTGTISSFHVTGLPSGGTASFSPASGAAGFSSTMTVQTTTSTPAGSYPLTISGTDGSLTYYACASACLSASQPYATLVVSAVPGFSMSVSPGSQTIGIGGGTTYTVTVTGTNGFTGTVDLSVTGLPAFSSANFSTETIAGSGSSVLTLTSTNSISPGTYTLTLTGTSGSLTETATATLVVTGANFSISATPQFEGINPGGTATYTVSTSVLSGFNGVIDLSVTGLPAGASATFTPTSIAGAGSSTLQITTTTGIAAGNYTLTVTGTSGTVTQTTTVTLEVT